MASKGKGGRFQTTVLKPEGAELDPEYQKTVSDVRPSLCVPYCFRHEFAWVLMFPTGEAPATACQGVANWVLYVQL